MRKPSAYRARVEREIRLQVKFCPNCGIEKKWTEFGQHRQYRHGLSRLCRECILAVSRRHYASFVACRRKRELGLKARIENIVRIDRICGGDPEKVKVMLRELRNS